MKIALLSPIAWRTPPVHYGPWEKVVSLLCEGLVKRGVDVTLFATGNSVTSAKHRFVSHHAYEEDRTVVPKVWEALHIAGVYEHANEFDIIHNNFDFLPLTYSKLVTTPVVTTIHGFSSPAILPVYQKYNKHTYYVAISDADRNDSIDYCATVYHGINCKEFTFIDTAGNYLLFFGRMHPDKGAKEAIAIARLSGKKLIMAGIIQDSAYFDREVACHLDNDITYVGNVGPKERDTLLGNAYALLHPISFEEPFGLSVVEAMACGTPVVAFNRGSMPELIESGSNGFLVNNVDEAVNALRKIPAINRAACRKRVADMFSVERMVDNYIRVYEEIISNNKREDKRPWGFYTVLANEADHKVKRIVVVPGGTLSLQRHQQHSEHWYVIHGEAVVTLNDATTVLKTGTSITIPCGSKHQVANNATSELVFIATQRRSFFGEDGSERFDDSYGRAQQV